MEVRDVEWGAPRAFEAKVDDVPFVFYGSEMVEAAYIQTGKEARKERVPILRAVDAGPERCTQEGCCAPFSADVRQRDGGANAKIERDALDGSTRR